MSEHLAEANVPRWDLADRLRKALREADVSVQEMAEYLEISRNTVGSWINGHHRPRPSDLKQWALRTGVSYRWLTYGELPRVDSNHQPDDRCNDLRIPWVEPIDSSESAPRSRNAAELLAMRTALPIRRVDLVRSYDPRSVDQVIVNE